MSFVFAILSGLVFGIGLIASGMTDPAKVKGFLDLFGAWDPSLALVMGGAIAVGAVAVALSFGQLRQERVAGHAGGAVKKPRPSTSVRSLTRNAHRPASHRS